MNSVTIHTPLISQFLLPYRAPNGYVPLFGHSQTKFLTYLYADIGTIYQVSLLLLLFSSGLLTTSHFNLRFVGMNHKYVFFHVFPMTPMLTILLQFSMDYYEETKKLKKMIKEEGLNHMRYAYDGWHTDLSI